MNQRKLQVYEKSTPLLVYNIRDAGTSGVDLTGFKLCAIMKNKVTGNIYMVFPSQEPLLDVLDIVEGEEEERGTVTNFVDSRYSYTTTDGKYVLKIPLWRIPDADISSGDFDTTVHLYNISSTRDPSNLIIGTEKYENLFLRGAAYYENMVIDSILISVLQTDFPSLLTDAKRSSAKRSSAKRSSGNSVEIS